MDDAELVELSEQAVNWLRTLAPLAKYDAARVLKLADELSACIKGCHACGGPRPCHCTNDE